MKRGRRAREGRISTLTAGSIGIVAIVLLTYLAFTKFANPFATPFTVHAVFSSASSLRPDSLVRIAGVNVGKVAEHQRRAGLQGGRERSLPLRRRRCHDDDRRAGPAAPHERDVQDPSPDLPRRQLLRRRQPWHARGTAGSGRLHVPDPAGLGAGSVRSGSHLAPGRHPTQPADPPAAVRHCGQAGWPRLQRIDPVLAAGVQVLLDRRRTTRSASSRTICRTGSLRRRRSRARSTRTHRTCRT